MSASSRLAAAVIALVGMVFVACTGSTASPSSSPAGSMGASPSPTPAGGPVTSERFGWSFELPPGWTYRPATEDWPVHTYPLPGAAYTDNFERPGGFPAIDISTQLLPEDQTPDEFLADLDVGNAAIGCIVEATDEITVDGVVGRLQRQECASGIENVWEVAVFDGDRVYLIYWIGLAGARAEDEPVFRKILDSFRFAAASA